jgi:exosortase/archaeosortase family protein
MGTDRRLPYLGLLAGLAAFIWAREIPFVSSLENTLPILLALPLFVFMGWPWRLRKDVLPLEGLAVGAAGLAAGLILDVLAVQAASWTWLLWAWLKANVEEEDLPAVRRLLVLPFLAFPCLDVEGEAVGWHFRLTGAWAAAQMFSAMGFSVVHAGCELSVHGLPVSIGEACSGINALQSMLIAGSALNFLYLGRTRLYWVNLAGLALVAWLANTARIVILCASALTLGNEFALGLFHTWGGWLVLFLMLLLSWGILSLQTAMIGKKPRTEALP